MLLILLLVLPTLGEGCGNARFSGCGALLQCDLPVPDRRSLNGQTDFESEGRVYITGSGSRLAVQVKNDATVVYSDAQRSRFIDTAKLGGIDTVIVSPLKVAQS